MGDVVLMWWTTILATAVAQPRVDGPMIKDYDRLVQDLGGQDVDDRKYAARELARRAKVAARRAGRRGGDLLVVDEAIQELDDLDRDVAPLCVSRLEVAGVTGPCARLLADVEHTAALPALQEARTAATGADARALDRAIDALRAVEES